jgi:hypothetical protein
MPAQLLQPEEETRRAAAAAAGRRRRSSSPGAVARSILALIALLLAISGSAAQSSRPARERPSFERYTSFLWMLDGPEISPELFASLIGLGVSGTNVAGTAPSAAHGRYAIPFYVDHAAGKGILALRPEEWNALRTAYLKAPLPELLHRPHCLDQPDSQLRLTARLHEVLAGAATNRPMAYALDDEISQTSHESPFDFCMCPATLDRFRADVAERYGTIEKLNRAWRTAFDSFASVVPLSTHDIRRRELILDPLQWNFAPWAEHRAFMEASMTATVRRLCREIKDADPRARAGFTGGGAPSAFSGLDWRELGRIVDFAEPYDIGGSRELVRSFAPSAAVVRTLFRDRDDARFNVHELWDYLLRGDRGVIIWNAGEYFPAKDPGKPSAWANTLAPVLRRFGTARAAEFLAAEPRRAEIAVLESQPANRMHWMLDSRGDAGRWIHRQSSYEDEHSSQNRTREGWQKLLEDLHLEYEHIAPKDLAPDLAARFKVLILPRAIALSDADLRAIAAFGETRTVIADCQLGLFSETLAVRARPPLDEVFGIERANRVIHLDEVRYTGPRDVNHLDLELAEPGIAVRSGVAVLHRVGEVPTMIVRARAGGGRMVYLNLLLAHYSDDRLLRSDESEIAAELRGIFRGAGVRTIAEVRFPNADPLPLRIVARESGRKTYLGIVANWRTSSTKIDRKAVAARKDPLVEVLLHRSGSVTDLFTGEAVVPPRSGAPSRVTSFTATVPVFGARIFVIESSR